MLKKTKVIPINVNLLFLQVGCFWENISSLNRKMSLIFINSKKVKTIKNLYQIFFVIVGIIFVQRSFN